MHQHVVYENNKLKVYLPLNTKPYTVETLKSLKKDNTYKVDEIYFIEE